MAHGSTRSEHRVQLFDTAPSLARTVSTFVIEGLQRAQAVLVVARALHWRLIERDLTDAGIAAADHVVDGSLTVLDAAATLNRFMRKDAPDADLFAATVGQTIRRLSASRGVWMFGEMVDVLAESGNLHGSEAVETMLDVLAEEVPLTVLCGYSSGHFAGPAGVAALGRICRAHTCVQSNPVDGLGAWLTGAVTQD